MIVTMKNIRRRRSRFEEFHRGALEENPAVRLVGIIVSRYAVHVYAGPVKKPVVTDQENFDR